MSYSRENLGSSCRRRRSPDPRTGPGRMKGKHSDGVCSLFLDQGTLPERQLGRDLVFAMLRQEVEAHPVEAGGGGSPC